LIALQPKALYQSAPRRDTASDTSAGKGQIQLFRHPTSGSSTAGPWRRPPVYGRSRATDVNLNDVGWINYLLRIGPWVGRRRGPRPGAASQSCATPRRNWP